MRLKIALPKDIITIANEAGKPSFNIEENIDVLKEKSRGEKVI